MDMRIVARAITTGTAKTSRVPIEFRTVGFVRYFLQALVKWTALPVVKTGVGYSLKTLFCWHVSVMVSSRLPLY